MRAQITLFIILGLILLFIAAAVLFLIPRLSENRGRLDQVQQVPNEVEPVVNFAEACLSAAAGKGLTLLGQQAGYIFQQQGGTSRDFLASEDSVFYLNRNGVQVAYLIQDGIGSPPGCIAHPPGYPAILYPYTDVTFAQTNPVLPNCFGKLLTLDPDRSADALATYIENNIQCDFGSFPQHTIVAGKPNITVIAQESSTVIQADWPLGITNKNTQAATTIETIRVTEQASILGMYRFVNGVLQEDVSDPQFVMTQATDPSYTIRKESAGEDDLFIVIDLKHSVKGQPWEFVFGRQNRPPALGYVTSFSTAGFTYANGNTFDYTNLQFGSLRVFDPDEDDLILSVLLLPSSGVPYDLATFAATSAGVTLKDTFPYTISDSSGLGVKLSVSDGDLEDYQDRDEVSGALWRIP